MRKELREERQHMVLWKQPLTTLFYFACEVLVLVKSLFEWMLSRKITVTLVLAVLGTYAYLLEHDSQVRKIDT